MSEYVDLEAVRYAAMQAVSPEMLADVQTDIFTGMVAIKVERMVYGHRLAEWDWRIEYPASLWQHVKMKCGLPYKSVPIARTIVRRRIYPDLPVLPEKKAGISFIVEDRA
jgi:hypothetical protein